MIFNKCWSPLFDSCTKRSDIFTAICLKHFDIPLNLWYLDNFKEIGNVFGTFLEEDMLFLDIGIMSTGYILVGIALRGGLVVEMTLQKIDHTFSQPLDYSRAHLGVFVVISMDMWQWTLSFLFRRRLGNGKGR